jgi:5-oxoprolinase (ATP-hydrolysing)
MSGRWSISTDTGGTFTDCYGEAPNGQMLRCKVLSSGCLRVRLRGWEAGKGWLEGLPVKGRDFYRGWTLRWVNGAGEGWVILGSGGDQVEVDCEVWQGMGVGALLELSTNEEAPVVGARLLTETALGQAFPALEMRLATTRATNALLEGKGSATVLFTTWGFGDVLEIGDQRRGDLFALEHRRRVSFVKRTVALRGRLTVEGDELEPLDEEEVRRAAREMVGLGVCHAALAFLHGDRFGRHEVQVAEWLREEGMKHVTLGGAIAPFPKLLWRAQSAVANATLTGPVESFVEGVRSALGVGGEVGAEVSLQMMTSAGGLEQAERVRPKDLLLSGPAGGVLGAAAVARQVGVERVLTLDMGGTSTDVARIDGRPSYRFVQRVGGMELMAPSVAIETVAAGGGSICQWTPQGLRVGPESAGSEPGPACYGKGGPLTVTDVNLLMGRFDAQLAPIPLDVAAAERALAGLLAEVAEATEERVTGEVLLRTLLQLAIEHMADAIRRISVAEGYAPKDYALLAFGGAGPQHACDVAARLGIQTVIVPRHAGILSAVGLHVARPERFAERQVMQRVEGVEGQLLGWVEALAEEAKRELERMLGGGLKFEQPQVLVEMRLVGQDQPLQVTWQSGHDLKACYAERFQALFGYEPPAGRGVEVVSLRVSVRMAEREASEAAVVVTRTAPASAEMRLLQDAFSTLVVQPGWEVEELAECGYLLRWRGGELAGEERANGGAAELTRDLLRHRLHSVVEEMGALLCRTAISTNIRERLDFSCAVLDAEGQLVSSAPHIPVHLGALGLCVRECVKAVALGPGDTLITNHPAFGGSHLPDVTLISPVHARGGQLLGYVANRAHHAEIGGLTPGSMPASARCLEEEGVVLRPQFLVRGGISCFEEVARLFTEGAFPSRNVADNLADLHAQLAANQLGGQRLKELADEGGAVVLARGMGSILAHSAGVMRRAIERLLLVCAARECLDDGSVIAVKWERRDGGLWLDFTGTSPVHAGNLNATPAIVRSAVLYVLRLWLQEDLPLNEGLLEAVNWDCSECLLNPTFSGDSQRDPAVVGGNVEVSQRLVDTLLKALGVQACSQGTMNNLLFGNQRFGYYETIAGGAGAGPGYHGASALHTHMTNTAITDPEILERRFPVRLRRFEVRRGSGGSGEWRGGDGVVREFEFLEAVTVSLLTQHRVAGPYGMNGGAEGARGRQWLLRGEQRRELPPSVSISLEPGDRVVVETPGGGGWGGV